MKADHELEKAKLEEKISLLEQDPSSEENLEFKEAALEMLQSVQESVTKIANGAAKVQFEVYVSELQSKWSSKSQENKDFQSSSLSILKTVIESVNQISSDKSKLEEENEEFKQASMQML